MSPWTICKLSPWSSDDLFIISLQEIYSLDWVSTETFLEVCVEIQLKTMSSIIFVQGPTIEFKF